MSQAFPGPYTDVSITQRGPFSQESTAEDVVNVRDLGADRSYQVDRSAALRSQDLSAQQQDPKPFPSGHKLRPGYDPYAIGGGLDSFLANSAE